MLSKWHSDWTAHLVALLGLAITVLLFSPGHLDPDTTWQLEQAQSGTFVNWHPPFMAWIWSWGLKILPGAWSIFLLSSGCLWFGLSWACSAFLPQSKWAAALCTLAIGLWPATLGVYALVWKDALFAASLMLAFGILLRWRGSRWAAVFSCIFILLALLVRHNGILAVMPFVPYWIHQLVPNKIWLRSLVFVTIVAGLILLPGWVDRALDSDKTSYPPQVLFTFDLAGISVDAGANQFPIGYQVSLEDLEDVYRPSSVLFLLWEGRGLRRPGFLENTRVTRSQLKEAWSSAIRRQPSSYFKHRMKFFCSFMKFCNQPVGDYFEEGGVPMASSPLRHDDWAQATVGWLQILDSTWVFDLRFYMSILVLLGVILVLKPDSAGEFLNELNVAWASAFTYWAGYLFVGVASDFRYAWWSCLVALVCSVQIVPRLLAKTRVGDAKK